MQTKTNRKSGFTLVEIMIVVAIIGLLAAIAIPNFIRARTKSQQNACINNLRQLDGAIQQWALETKQSATANVNSTNIAPYMGRGTAGNLPVCPSDSANSGAGTFATSYVVTQVDEAPTCKILPTNSSASVLDGHIL
jgi:prepilin-type N-terminal cleavage/methylation domain-containing protein